MGLWSGSVPGHTGTQFKHRKGFVKQKELLRKNLKGGNNRVGEWDGRLGKRNNRRRVALYVLLLLVLPVMIYLSWQFSQLLTTTVRQETQQNYKLYQEERYEHESVEYWNMVKLGKVHLNSGDYAYARRLYQGALALFPYAWDANAGLTMTLTKMCVENGQYCEEARAYLEFCRSLPDRDERSLDGLEDEMNGKSALVKK
ncbi:MAG: tetratricopeptide repeat protein [Lewinella sp.]|uniref:tetratricopeptide repeat protein n=1 Tax=Lewinella sp. TaxID=2004506 RepID=UPI003D6C5CFC